MTALIEKTDPQYFEITSDELYDRHDYKIVSSDGKFVIVDSWYSAREIWWNTPSTLLSHIEVLDKNKGFK